MAHKAVGVNSSFTIADGTSVRGVVKTAHKTDTLRIFAKGNGAHVAIGTLPTAANTNYYVGAGEPETLSIGKPQLQRVVGVTPGTTTTIDFPEGTGSPFAVGDAVTLTITGSQSYLDFEHKIVSTVNTSADRDGYFNTRITVDHDSSGISTSYSAPGGGNNYAELRGSFMVAAMGDGAGTLHYQQVQISGAS
jgi:hypothetical protein|tara:strand:- start:471 stop:1046 length:576 start_codon:yes stop_codon:yes gene_type:complete